MDRTLLALAAIAAAVGIYPIVVYPILVRVLAKVRPRPWEEQPATFAIAHVVTVHNEELRIRAKLENTLAIRYPGGKPDIVVASDGSTDGTEAIVAEFASRNVRWLPCPRKSKENAQITAVGATSAPVIVFSDASTMVDPGSVEALLEPFADPEVGAASGADMVAGEGTGTGEDIYIRYEMALRRAESAAGSLVGLSGCLFAARRVVAEAFKDDVPSDLGAALVCLSMNLRAVHADRARCTYTTTPAIDREFRRKRRTALRGLRGLIAYRGALLGHRFVATWELLSHKILRFLSPVFLAVSALFVLASAATGNTVALWLSAAFVLGALAVVPALFWEPARRLSLPRALGFFVLSNAAVVAALIDLVTGRTAVQWTPTRREAPTAPREP